MRVIAIEEHYAHPGLQPAEALANLRKHPQLARIQDKLEDLGAGRLADMDAAGIDMQVLSHTVPGAEALPAAQAVDVVRQTNDDLAEVIAAHPDRFAGFAALPMRDPQAAATELQRAVGTLGFCGAMINGLIEGRFLDHPDFTPLLSTAADLGVPLYLHPSFPPPQVAQIYFGGLPPVLADLLATAGWGWHAETALHVLRLISTGVFDRLPELRVIVGHMGEMIPFALARIDTVLSPMTELRQPVAQYFQTNVWFTTSGYTTFPPLQCALSTVGIDRLIFSVDYPYTDNASARALLDTAPISPVDREKLAHATVEALLRV
ncbi:MULTISPECIES: amidohydrolase family protein [Mycolicibacterium]|uniref:Amidohydrolase n=3 Tax=Mycolicibacterium TaxID=1866885 RepID=A0A0J6ZEV7_9MYCO|nr:MULTISPECIES: amidohydrolase family protein [Mycolicibacterium]ADU01942.1 predicted TIM-barrel fold metal-dependent hydrolase [Mycolicibacterium gilvum Spyr1]KMO83331.1 Amidohydrolase [Mycolicibacterium chlorophenolicum]MCV7155725.1 amidohydrolase [Mycolicibacterium pyrenivorans]MDN4519663.1 amidohydrolase family protein [Mycolicibacterium austroafricanum]